MINRAGAVIVRVAAIGLGEPMREGFGDDGGRFAKVTAHDGVNLHKGAIAYSDALIQGTEKLEASLAKEAKASKKPMLDYQGEDTLLKAYFDFYKELMN